MGAERPRLTIVADQKWKSRRAPHRPLTLDDLGEWFAAKVGLEYYHIDPLKIDPDGLRRSARLARRGLRLGVERHFLVL